LLKFVIRSIILFNVNISWWAEESSELWGLLSQLSEEDEVAQVQFWKIIKKLALSIQTENCSDKDYPKVY
jgi:hypothetical protein